MSTRINEHLTDFDIPWQIATMIRTSMAWSRRQIQKAKVAEGKFGEMETATAISLAAAAAFARARVLTTYAISLGNGLLYTVM